MPHIILFKWKIIFSGSLLHKTPIPWTLLDSVTCSLVSSTAGALPGSVAVTSGVLEPGPVSATTTSLSLESGVVTLSFRALLPLL